MKSIEMSPFGSMLSGREPLPPGQEKQKRAYEAGAWSGSSGREPLTRAELSGQETFSPSKRDGVRLGRRQEDEILRGLLRFQAEMLDTAAIWIDTLDAAGHVTFWNRAAERISGYTRKEVLGHDRIWEWIYPDPDYRNGVLAEVVEIIRKGKRVENFETIIRCKDGRRAHISWHSNNLLDDKGQVVGSIALGADVSEQKRLESQILQAQKMEAIGVMAGGIAHDFNNLLVGVLGTADMTLLGLPPDSPAVPALSRIKKVASRLAELTQQILTYSGHSAVSTEHLSISKVIEELAPLLQVSISKSVTVTYDLRSDLQAVKADAGKVQQIAMNLILNAAEACGDRGGRVMVRTREIFANRMFLAGCLLGADLPEGRYGCLEVRDTGIGMSPEVMRKIFDPFFSTKFTGRGLGLAMVIGIVRSHKGAIKVASAPGRGSAFRVLLPCAPEALDRFGERPAEAEPDPWVGSGTVLLVDDEELVREVGSAMLSKMGFEVVLASDGQEALDILGQRAAELAIAVLDLKMPRLDGMAVLAELRKLRGDLPVLLSSGYPREYASDSSSADDLVGFVQKPFLYSSLQEKLKALLERRPDSPATAHAASSAEERAGQDQEEAGT